MVDRITDKLRQEQFEQQLQNSVKRVVEEFISNPKYEVVRPEYARHFDEIKSIIDNSHKELRSCAEDIKGLSSVIAKAISSEYLFFYDLHRAIRDGILTKSVL